jgi:hypothetical protein
MRTLPLAAVLVVLFAADPARADEVADRQVTAASLSVGASLASLGVIGAGVYLDDEIVASAGVGAFVLLPSLGHWYVGDPDWKGLGIRVGGVALAKVGYLLADWAIGIDDASPEDGDEHEAEFGLGLGMVAAGGLAVIGGVIYDWATVREAARLSFTPIAAPGVAGLSVAGNF